MHHSFHTHTLSHTAKQCNDEHETPYTWFCGRHIWLVVCGWCKRLHRKRRHRFHSRPSSRGRDTFGVICIRCWSWRCQTLCLCKDVHSLSSHECQAAARLNAHHAGVSTEASPHNYLFITKNIGPSFENSAVCLSANLENNIAIDASCVHAEQTVPNNLITLHAVQPTPHPMYPMRCIRDHHFNLQKLSILFNKRNCSSCSHA